MRHRMLRNKMGKYGSHRRQLLKNQLRELVEHKSIVTTVTKAKNVQRIAEKVLTKAIKASRTDNKAESVALRRQINWYLNDKKLTNKLVEEIAKEFTKVSGFTRVIRIGTRRGDASEMALVEIIH